MEGYNCESHYFVKCLKAAETDTHCFYLGLHVCNSEYSRLASPNKRLGQEQVANQNSRLSALCAKGYPSPGTLT
jgi:hypothetical protein